MLDDEIKYFDETGSLGFLFLEKNTGFSLQNV